MPRLLIFSLLLAVASPALAVDGVLEINQTCAKETGCFSGDTPGYPVTINGSAGRSYKLTSDIGGVIGLNTNAIEIIADDITIDLAGFRIICTTFMPPFIVAFCSESGGGTGSGIVVDNQALRAGVEVRNGSVIGMPLNGVTLGKQSVVHNLRVSQNRINGIVVDIVSTVSGNTASENGGTGILAGSGSTVSGNTAYSNGNVGILTITGSTVTENTAYDNEGDGIFADAGSNVSGNTAYQNGGAGILVNAGSNVSGNTVRDNGGYGLSLGALSGYRENVISGNTTGTVTGGVNAGGNVCDGSLTCP